MEHLIDRSEGQEEKSREVIVINNPPHQTSLLLINKVDKEIMESIRSLAPPPNESCIFRVNEGLRHVNKKAYTPVLVSIGPYHYGNSKLGEMQEHKRRYLDFLLKQMNESSVNRYLQVMIELEHRARNCYANPINLKGDKFVKMMLLDACFVIEFLRKRSLARLREKDDPIFKESWMETAICRDLLLLENQLPFFVLSELYSMTQYHHENIPLTTMALYPIVEILPEALYFCKNNLSTICTYQNMHFLDLVHNFCVPTPSSSSRRPNDEETCIEMPCVMELWEAGVKFEVKEGGDVNMFDINFDLGYLKIPKFQVSDFTETFLRNIIAYEQHSSDVELKYFTDFMCFMDLLINSKEDVNKLCGSSIISNLLGDDGEVARIFNKLGDGTTIQPSFYYSDLCKKVNAHCEKWSNRMMAKLRHNYFNNPWAGVSTIAAVVLLILTLIQTVASLITLHA